MAFPSPMTHTLYSLINSSSQFRKPAPVSTGYVFNLSCPGNPRSVSNLPRRLWWISDMTAAFSEPIHRYHSFVTWMDDAVWAVIWTWLNPFVGIISNCPSPLTTHGPHQVPKTPAGVGAKRSYYHHHRRHSSVVIIKWLNRLNQINQPGWTGRDGEERKRMEKTHAISFRTPTDRFHHPVKERRPNADGDAKEMHFSIIFMVVLAFAARHEAHTAPFLLLLPLATFDFHCIGRRRVCLVCVTVLFLLFFMV